MSWMHSLLGRALAQASARARGESPRAQELLRELAGRRLAVAVRGTPWEQAPLAVLCSGETLRLQDAAADGGVDATLCGAPLSLLAMLRDPEGVIQRGDVRISGDAQLAQRFQELAELLIPDVEHELSRVLGRSTAHLLMRGLRRASQAARAVAWTSVRNLAEYLAHENAQLVPRTEAEHFLRGVELAREQLDRLEARIGQLERQAAGTGGAEPA
jgi:ubiquinone biosynthesis accessory factor UbiJ